ncbi:hypothetical protein vseg_009300 [Gypsophila vaccaria]
MASNNNVKQYTLQKPPKMLKEFLQETTTTPRRLPSTTTLPRTRSSRSRAAAETALNKLISAFNTILDKCSIKRTTMDQLKSLKNKRRTVSNKKIKVKDILRWRSFRDAVVIAEGSSSKPLDKDSYSLQQFEFDTTVSSTVSTTNTEDICSSSSCSSELGLGLDTSQESSRGEIGEYRSSMDELPCWWGNYFDEGDMWDQGDNDVVVTVCGVDPREDNNNCTRMEDEKEQHSPVSVLDSPFREELSDHEFESSFDQSLANMERTKQSLLQRIQWLENLAGVSEEDDEEESRLTENTIETITKENLSRVICKFVRGEQCFEDKEACITEMETDGKWTSKFEDDKEDLGVELEVELLTDLVNEVLVDVLG